MSITDPLLGRKLGDYVILEMLGQGGMARVYKGYDERLDRNAAVKIIDAHLVTRETEAEYRERFRREARAIARLKHANIVNIYQFGEDGQMYYMAMEYISGQDLRQIIKDHNEKADKMPYAQVLHVVKDICSALDYAHGEGVIHRDIKPSNIMVTPSGQSVLMDFGLALSVPEGTLGSTFGSVHYIAPEQAVSSARAVPQSDLYSLGIVLYEMLTGRVPFDDRSTMSVALKHLSDPPPPPSALNPNISAELEAVVLKMLDKEPRKRYASGLEFARAVEYAMGMAEEDSIQDLHDKPGSRPKPMIPAPMAVSKPTPPTADALLRTDTYRKLRPASPLDDSPTISEPKRPSQIMPPAEILPAKKRRLSPSVVAGVLIFVGILAALALFLFNNNQGREATPTLLAAAAETTETASPLALVAAATASDTPRPTRTVRATATRPSPTPRPSATPTERATATVTASRTPRPTDEPTLAVIVPSATPTPENWPLMLYYDHRTLVLVNRSENGQDITDLFFVRTDAAGTEYDFASNDWTNDSTLGRFRSNACLQVWTNAFTFLEADDAVCSSRQGWRQLNTARQFWISDEAGATFEVLHGNVLLATCPASPSRRTADFEFACGFEVQGGR
ncbi:MAG: protein kinase [Chloroflexi bacterium]|nr:protein kinase [Chloroflexota bacterium]